MYRGEIFLSVKDMMRLMGTDNYENARKRHKTVREAIKKGKGCLTIREFCRHEGIVYEDIWKYLRNTPLPD